MKRFTPTTILFILWILYLIIGILTPNAVIQSIWGDSRILSFPTIIWILFCCLAFAMGAFIEKAPFFKFRRYYNKPITITPQKIEENIRKFKFLLFLITFVLLGRFIWSVILAGGLKNAFLMMFFKPIDFKFHFWQKTNIHGVGMIAELIVSATIFIFSYYAIILNYSGIEKNNIELEKFHKLKHKIVKYLMLTVLVLFVYLLFSNERVPFVGGLLGGLVAFVLIRDKISIKPFVYLGITFIWVWVFVEAARRQFLNDQNLFFLLEFAKKRLFVYFAGGIRNIDTFVRYIDDHSFGWYTFNFLITPFKLDTILKIPDSFYGFGPNMIRPGYGAVPPFGTAYADFGLVGLGFFMLWGFIYQKIYRYAIQKNNFIYLQIYAYFLVGLIVSFLVFLPSYSRFWVVILGLLFLNQSISSGMKFKGTFK